MPNDDTSQFVKVPRWAIERNFQGLITPQGAFALKIYMHLCKHARNGDHVAWPSHDTLAKASGCSDKSVERNMRLLETRGFVKTITRGGGRHRSNRILILYDSLAHDDWWRSENPDSPSVGVNAKKSDTLAVVVSTEIHDSKSQKLRHLEAQIPTPTVSDKQKEQREQSSSSSNIFSCAGISLNANQLARARTAIAAWPATSSEAVRPTIAALWNAAEKEHDSNKSEYFVTILDRGIDLVAVQQQRIESLKKQAKEQRLANEQQAAVEKLIAQVDELWAAMSPEEQSVQRARQADRMNRTERNIAGERTLTAYAKNALRTEIIAASEIEPSGAPTTIASNQEAA